MPRSATVPVLLVTGATGVGKSQTVAELSRLLDDCSVDHARLDWDTLIMGPVSRDEALIADALASAWRVHRRAGATRLLLAASLERKRMLSDIGLAVPGANLRAFRLVAPVSDIADRLRYRERGGLSEATFIRDIVEDLRVYDELANELEAVDTLGRDATEVASEILERSGWVSQT